MYYSAQTLSASVCLGCVPVISKSSSVASLAQPGSTSALSTLVVPRLDIDRYCFVRWVPISSFFFAYLYCCLPFRMRASGVRINNCWGHLIQNLPPMPHRAQHLCVDPAGAFEYGMLMTTQVWLLEPHRVFNPHEQTLKTDWGKGLLTSAQVQRYAESAMRSGAQGDGAYGTHWKFWCAPQKFV